MAKDILRACLRCVFQVSSSLQAGFIKLWMNNCQDHTQNCIGFRDFSQPAQCSGRPEAGGNMWVLLHHCLIYNELLRFEFYSLKCSHHGLVKTTRAIDLPNLEVPQSLLPNNKISDHRTNILHVSAALAMDTAFLVWLTLHSERYQGFFCNWDGKKTDLSRICQDPWKVPGQYNALHVDNNAWC